MCECVCARVCVCVRACVRVCARASCTAWVCAALSQHAHLGDMHTHSHQHRDTHTCTPRSSTKKLNISHLISNFRQALGCGCPRATCLHLTLCDTLGLHSPTQALERPASIILYVSLHCKDLQVSKKTTHIIVVYSGYSSCIVTRLEYY